MNKEERATRWEERAARVQSLEELDFISDLREDAREWVQFVADKIMGGAEAKLEVLDKEGSFRISIQQENFRYWNKGEKQPFPCTLPGVADDNNFIHQMMIVDECVRQFKEKDLPLPINPNLMMSRDDTGIVIGAIRYYLEDNYGLDVARDFIKTCEERAKERQIEEIRPVTCIDFDFTYDPYAPGNALQCSVSEHVEAKNLPDFGKGMQKAVERALKGYTMEYFGMEPPQDENFKISHNLSKDVGEIFPTVDFSEFSPREEKSMAMVM